MFKYRPIYLIVGLMSLYSHQVLANDPLAAIKNIQQSPLDNSVDFAMSAKREDNDVDHKSLGDLLTYEVNSEILQPEIKAYWDRKVGKSITNLDIKNFKSWAWAKFRDAGYLAYVSTDDVRVDGGLKLYINVVTPKLGKVEFKLAELNLSEREKVLLKDRLVKAFSEGDGVDTMKLDNRLQNANFGYPFEFDANLKQVAPGITDMTLTSRNLAHRPGKLLNGLIQANSYGLEQYGRGQLMGLVSYSGLTPLSQLKFSAQASEGIKYGRLQYDSPVQFLRGEARLYGSYADFSSIKNSLSATQGDSFELGLGISHLLGFTRYAAIKSHADFSARQTENALKISGLSVSDMRSYQGKLAIGIDNSKVDADQYDAILTFTGGVYDNADPVSKTDGDYKKLEAKARYVKSLDKDKKTLLQTRFQGQVAGSHLDAYDRISIGGVSGVRAYSSVDGIGDQGATLTFDLIRKLPYQQYIGAFYDAGIVKPFKYGMQGVFNDTYTLQALGVQYGLNYKNVSMSASVAKGIGSYDGYVKGNEESSPHNWRGNLTLTLMF